LFAVNRSVDRPLTLTTSLRGLGEVRLAEATTLSGPDPYVRNTADAPGTVVPRPNSDVRLADGTLEITLPPVSWNVIRLTRP
jgi:alpha-N-arabinofuranosidase